MTSLSLSESELDEGRYEFERELGQGGTGSVHLVKDRETGEHVALKKLYRVDAKSVLRLKREFRSVADLNHPNIVKLYDLGRTKDGWILTMEFLEGADLLSYLRPNRVQEALSDTAVRLDAEQLERVLSTFYQLTCGVRALHRAGMLHRDLKPSNVMVAHGRAVVLDFGLVRELDRRAAFVTEDGIVSGTPAYMAPEQALGEGLTEASDWYALGVMLFEALSGELPFDGGVLDIVRAKLDLPPPSLATLVENLPPRLDELCTALLQRDPARRPNGDQILAVLEPRPASTDVHLQTDAGSTVQTETQQHQTAVELFGREAELAQLRAAMERVEDGSAMVVHVHGASGSGKSALVEAFLDRLADQTSPFGGANALVLRSRCYEREAMPFKALDGLMDALSRHFARLDDVEVGHLLPQEVGALARVFPVLSRLSAVQRLAAMSLHRDALQDRQRAESALRELCERLARRRPLVLWIDDLHWGDLDSARILKGWLSQLAKVPVLLVLSYRSEEVETSACLQVVREREHDTSAVRAPEVWLPIQGLPNTDVHALCRKHLGTAAHAHADVIERIVRESQGSPFLASQLAALAYVKIKRGDTDLDALSIEALVAQYGALLPEPARHVLTVLAVAGRPVSSKLALRAAGVRRDGRALVHALRGLNLVRTRAVGGERLLEVYHDRVRDRVQSTLSAAQRERIHADLLRAAEFSAQADPDWLHVLALGAGQRDVALRHALIAAERASTTLAFERAAELYAKCLELSDSPSAADGSTLWRKLAWASASCGRGVKAAEAYLEAAKLAPPNQTVELLRLAASHLVRSGRFEEGEQLVQRVLSALQIHVPESERGLIAAIVWERARLSMRGMSYTARGETDVPARLLAQVDLFETLRTETQSYDPVRAALFQARSLRLALDAGEPVRVVRALCGAANTESLSGSPQAARRVEELLARAGTLADRLGTDRERAFVLASRSVTSFMLGRPSDVLAPSYEAERLSRANPAADGHGDYYLRFNVVSARIGALHTLGQQRRCVAELSAAMQEARATDNRAAQLALMLNQTIVEEIQGQTANSRSRLDALQGELPSDRFGILHALHMISVMRVACTTRQHDWALEYLNGRWDQYLRSPIHRTAFLAVLARATRARLLLDRHVLDRRDGSPSAELQDDLRALAKLPITLASPAKLRVEARLAFIEGSRERAIEHLRAARQQYEGLGTLDEVARCQFGIGALIGSHEGGQLMAAAERRLADGGIADPLADLQSYFPELFG